MLKLFNLFILLVALFAYEADACAITILLIGDSITRSYTNGGGSVSGTGFPETDVGSYSLGLAQSLGPRYSVTNVGCSGTTSFQWTPNWNPAAFPYIPTPNYCNGIQVNTNLFTDYVYPNPDVVTIMLGTNDVFWWEVLAVNYQIYMTQLVNGLIASGAGSVILMTAPPLPGATVLKNNLLAGYRAAVLDICDTVANVYCIDTNTLLNADISSYFFGSSAHPSAAGHEVIRAALHDKVMAIPEPSSLTLLLSGILSLVAISGKRYVR